MEFQKSESPTPVAAGAGPENTKHASEILGQKLVSGFGKFHTNEFDPAKPDRRLTEYAATSLAEIRAMVDSPPCTHKDAAQWFIPSSLLSRSFTTQEKNGKFWMLWADLDDGKLPGASALSRDLADLLGSVDHEVYTSRSATPERKKSRILVPLGKPLCGADWLVCQRLLNAAMESVGYTCDPKNAGAGQLCYLPNKGEIYEHDGLRNGLFFDPLAHWAGEIEKARQTAANEAAAAQYAAREARNRAKSRAGTGGDLITAFNAAVTVEEILMREGYARRGQTFRHPGSESGSFSASVKDGRVHSLSSSDPLFSDGAGAHDAFSAFTILMHGGDESAALKEAGNRWIQIGSESWNKAKQREFKEAQRAEKAASKQPRQAATTGGDGNEQNEDLEPPITSDFAVADQLAKEVEGSLKFTPGIEWLANKGTHWERDTLSSRIEPAQFILKQTLPFAQQKEHEKLCSAAKISAVLSLAKADPRIATPIDRWEAPPNLINTTGGVYDLTTGMQVERDRNHLFLHVTPITPAKTITPVWDKFLTDVFNGDLEMVEFIQRLMGYILTGYTREQKLFFLYGSGANGKSIFLEVLEAISGGFGHNFPSEALMTTKNERHPTTLAALHGKRLAISSEIEESGHWAESRIKSLTGDATLTAHFMHKDEFTFRITHKHVIAGNFKPRLKGDDYAMQRRMVFVHFGQKFEGARRDEKLSEKLRAEYGGILHWAIEGAAKWFESGLMIPAIVAADSRDYMAEQDDLQLWIDECCIVNSNLKTKSGELFSSFSCWKQRNGEHAGSSKSFSQRLERKFTKHKCHGSPTFLGLGVKPVYSAIGLGGSV